MNKKIILLSSLFLFFISLFTFIFTRENSIDVLGEKENSQKREIVVYLDKDPLKSKNKAKSYKNIKKDYSDNGVIVVGESEIDFVKNKKKRNEIIDYDFNNEYRVTTTPNDPLYSQQWALSKIGAPEAWGKTTGSDEIVIAVLDTGFVLDHEDLVGRFIDGWDVIGGDSDPSLPAGGGTAVSHGTLVSGVIAGIADNSKGVAGLDWNVRIMPIRVMDNNGGGNTATVTAGINYAFSNGADIINMSLGGDNGDSVLESAINNAYNSGITLVAASGNDSRLGISYPAKYQNVIAVGSSDSSDIRAASSNYGPELDIVAPGVSIMTTATIWNGSGYTTNQYGSASGTSLAAPYVSALVSLVVSVGDYSPLEVFNFIKAGSEKIGNVVYDSNGWHQEYGFGRIRAINSVNYAIANEIPVSPVSPKLSSISLLSPTKLNATTRIIGNTLSANFAIKNNNQVPITLERLKLDVRGGTTALDLAGGSNVTIGAGETLWFSSLPGKSVYVNGSGKYRATIKIKFNDGWFGISGDSRPYLNCLKFDPSYIKIDRVLYFSPNPAQKGAPIAATYRLYNTKGTFKLDRVKVSVTNSQHFNGYSNIYIGWAKTYSFKGSRAIDLPGTYYGRISYMVNGRWYNVGIVKTLRVTK